MDGSLLQEIGDQARDILRDPGVRGIALGLPEMDRQLWRLGLRWLERRGFKGSGSGASDTNAGPDVYLATHVYEQGGHTALIGDFVAARRRGEEPHLILTAVGASRPVVPSESIRARMGIAANNITVLRGPSLAERLDQLFERLIELRPGHLFLFHHGYDPLPVAVAQPAICRRLALVHHADATPTLGLHIPGIAIIDLNPWAAAMSRIKRLASDLLLLTCADPGPRPPGFLGSGGLVTASSGSAQKFAADYFYTYPEIVVAVLQSTGGRHVHVGQLSENTLAEVTSAMTAAGIDPRRFVHCGLVPSVAQALWDHRCDVFLASFPADGARTLVEVAASGTPYVAHSTTPLRTRNAMEPALGIPGTVRWHTREELVAALRMLADPDVLAEKSRLARAAYLDLHHPEKFRATLEDIVEGRGGIEDPEAVSRDRQVLGTLVRALTVGVVDQMRAARSHARGLGEEAAALRGQFEREIGSLASRLDDARKREQVLRDALRRLDESLQESLRRSRKDAMANRKRMVKKIEQLNEELRQDQDRHVLWRLGLVGSLGKRRRSASRDRKR